MRSEDLRGAEGEASPTEVWERHAAWWQREFTGGADVEYTEQILPLAAEHLAGAERVLDLGCGDWAGPPACVGRLGVVGGFWRPPVLPRSPASFLNYDFFFFS